ncbi:unnamed protein product [Rotaria sordida]|uniref:Uncharacterized protein n=1 Tax=Rotaria sordida TaxID=392033 RepID=A0A814U3V2_9BILA|nr:unnamed protein product [Rotaria sordida]CAF1431808.1 unnamed protein product [Rotaria sordida]
MWNGLYVHTHSTVDFWALSICLYHLSDDDDNQLSEDAINYAVPFITVPDDDSKGLVLARNKAISFDEESIDNMSM